MGDDLYKLIPEEGKHLAESRNTKGAYRGVYLDDETNKPSGAGEFVKVNPEELNNEAAVQANSNEETVQKNNTIDAEQGNNDTNAVQDTKASSDVNGYVAIATAMFGLGILVANAYPHAKKWVKETAVPSARSSRANASPQDDSRSENRPFFRRAKTFFIRARPRRNRSRRKLSAARVRARSI